MEVGQHRVDDRPFKSWCDKYRRRSGEPLWFLEVDPLTQRFEGASRCRANGENSPAIQFRAGDLLGDLFFDAAPLGVDLMIRHPFDRHWTKCIQTYMQGYLRPIRASIETCLAEF